MNADPDRLLTPDEVARLFRVSLKTIRRWTQAGDLADCMVRTPGGTIRYREDAILARIAPDRPAERLTDGP